MHQTQWGPERPLPPPVSLASQSHHEKPPEVTWTRRSGRACTRAGCIHSEIWGVLLEEGVVLT